jgi:hypothetical protein
METVKLDKKYATKVGLARHYGVCPRTINGWMRLGLLVFFRIKRVVRFDIAACDASLGEKGI